MGKKAFSLAEILITLTIIGVIAVLVIPNLLKNYKKTEIEIQLKSTYSTLSNALKLAQIKHGSKNTMIEEALTNHGNKTVGEYFLEKNLEPHLKIVKSCKNENGKSCNLFPYSIEPYRKDDIKNESFLGVYGRNGAQIQLANGALVYIGNYTYLTKNIMFKIDINGKKGPNLLMRDIFHLNIATDNFEAINFGNYTGSTNNKKLYTKCERGNLASNAFGCGGLIMQNGWKIPTDYPFKF